MVTRIDLPTRYRGGRPPAPLPKAPPMILLRSVLGETLRGLRQEQGRTLREVSTAARVSLGYLSEVERGQKEASSELLSGICGALGVPLSTILGEVSDEFRRAEGAQQVGAPARPLPVAARRGEHDTVARAA